MPNFKRSSLGFLLFSHKNRALSQATSRTQDNGTASKLSAGGHWNDFRDHIAPSSSNADHFFILFVFLGLSLGIHCSKKRTEINYEERKKDKHSPCDDKK